MGYAVLSEQQKHEKSYPTPSAQKPKTYAGVTCGKWRRSFSRSLAREFLTLLQVAWFSLRNLGSSLTPSAEGTSTDASSDDSLEEGMGSVVAPFVDGGESATTLASTTLSSFAYPIPHEHHEGAAGAPAEEDGAMSDLSEPLLLSGDGPNGAYDS